MSLLKAVAGGVAGFFTGGWGGAAVGAIQGYSSGSSAGPGAPPPTNAPPIYGGRVANMGGYDSGTRNFFAPAVRPPPVMPGAGVGRVRLPAPVRTRGNGSPPPGGQRGTRGGNGGGVGGVAPIPFPYDGGHRRRYRRMNVCNSRALRRAIRRVKAFRKLSHSIEMMLPKRKAACPPVRRERKC
jgi:hypothetical protein